VADVEAITSPEARWKTTLRPIGHWLRRLLPARIFQRFYSATDFGRDILLSLHPEEPPKLHLPGHFKPAWLELCIAVRNASPYLDARIVSWSLMLTSADSWGSQGGLFGDGADSTASKLERGGACYLHPRLFLNEYQLRTAQLAAEKRARLDGLLVVRMKTPLGRISVHREFNIAAHLAAGE